MITIATLMAAGIGPTQARAFVKPLADACELFELNTVRRQAHFFGQFSYETAGFIHLEESMLYRDPIHVCQTFRSAFRGEVDALVASLKIENPNVETVDAYARAMKQVAGPYVCNPEKLASRAYAGKFGNGDEASGEGWSYRGRGLPQLTGKSAYEAAAKDLGEPYDVQPDLVANVTDAVLVGGWYWRKYRLNVQADANDFDGCTRMVNGPAMLGAKERRDLTMRALQAFA